MSSSSAIQAELNSLRSQKREKEKKKKEQENRKTDLTNLEAAISGAAYDYYGQFNENLNNGVEALNRLIDYPKVAQLASDMAINQPERSCWGDSNLNNAEDRLQQEATATNNRINQLETDIRNLNNQISAKESELSAARAREHQEAMERLKKLLAGG